MLIFFLTADYFLPVSGGKGGERARFGYKQLQITSSQFNDYKGKRASLSWHSGIIPEGEALGLDPCSGVGLMLGRFAVAKGRNLVSWASGVT